VAEFFWGGMRMRNVVVIAALVALVVSASGHSGTPKRYGIEADVKKYPHGTPKDALGSVLKALGEKDNRYLLAWLADPEFVDKRVAAYAQQLPGKLSEAEKKSLAFDKLVERTTENFQDDPTKIKELQRFLKDGEWEEGANEAVAKLKNVQARKVFMKKIEDRWTLQDREK
jgi:hypothetical protein